MVRVPGMISLGGGLPNSETFPIVKATITLRDGKTFDISEKEMATALQYSDTVWT